MPIELKIDSRMARIQVLEKTGSFYKVLIDDREYEVDIEKVETGAYSILYNGKSINMEMIEGHRPNHYKVNTFDNYYEIDIIDAATRYHSKSKKHLAAGENIISTPMPGKIVKILVQEGDPVEEGQTVIIVSAMKMESEYKSPGVGTVKKIYVREGDAVEGQQPLVEIETV